MRYEKGHISYWQGKTIPDKVRAKISESMKGKNKGELNGTWKGNEASYQALHAWVRKELGKASKCANNSLHTSKRYQWGNISGEYKRELSDWHQLCASCNNTDGIFKPARFKQAMEILK